MAPDKPLLPSFHVYVRLRPSSSNESSVVPPELNITQDEGSRSISLSTKLESGPIRKWHSVTPFARMFSGSATNGDVYEETVKPALAQVMDGNTCNFFAYGHSGSGKTHTIIGYEYDNAANLGLCLSAARDLFRAIGEQDRETKSSDPDAEHDKDILGIAVRLYEVRGKCAFDLFNGAAECHIRQGPDGQTHIRGQTEMLEGGKVRVCPIVAKPFWSFDELRQVLLAGLKLRAVGSSSTHNESSRTHAFIELEVVSRTLLEAREAVIERESELVPVGKRATDVYLEEQMKSLIRTDNGQYIQNPERPLNQGAIDAAETEKGNYEARLERAKERVRDCLLASRDRCLGGKFVFVDLAGSEYFDQEAETSLKQTPRERQQGRQINADLFGLKEVIRAKASGQVRVPFRSSPLTMVLRSHFDGTNEGRSSIILTVSSLEAHFAATKNTLSYGALISGR
ncbi:kinesin family member 2/24 [Paraphoma chrysanthemicola]|nr:kinesin family member 2/24 [Paraphoma chrysanthemicola]